MKVLKMEKQIEVGKVVGKEDELYIRIPNFRWWDELHDLYIYLEPVYEDDKLVDIRMWQQFCLSPDDPKYNQTPPASLCDDGRDIDVEELYEELKQWLQQK